MLAAGGITVSKLVKLVRATTSEFVYRFCIGFINRDFCKVNYQVEKTHRVREHAVSFSYWSKKSTD